MKKIAYSLVGLVLLLSACDAGSGVCETNADCVGSEQCLWMKRNNQVVGKRCVLKCDNDGECGGQACAASASSCASCNDNIRVCNE